MPKQPLGVTFTVPPGQEATGVYDDPGGVEAFETDDPYLLEDGRSLQPPLAVKIMALPMHASSTGDMQAPLAISLGTDPEVPANAVTHNGEVVTHNGEIVTHGGE